MYNPEKQARAPGGRFGGKVVNVERVTADAEHVAEAVGELASNAATLVERRAVDLIDTNNDGVVDVNDIGRTSLVALFGAVGVIAVAAGLLSRCIAG